MSKIFTLVTVRVECEGGTGHGLLRGLAGSSLYSLHSVSPSEGTTWMRFISGKGSIYSRLFLNGLIYLEWEESFDSTKLMKEKIGLSIPNPNR